MARDPNDVAVAQLFPDAFATHVAALGAASPDALTDADFSDAAAKTAWQNRATIYGQALIAEGHALDLTRAPDFAAKLRAVGATHRHAQEYALGEYGNELGPAEAFAKYQRLVNQASSRTVPSPLFDTPNE